MNQQDLRFNCVVLYVILSIFALQGCGPESASAIGDDPNNPGPCSKCDNAIEPRTTSIMGINFAGLENLDNLMEMMGPTPGYTLETKYLRGDFIDMTLDRLRELNNRGLTVILRIDFEPGKTIPPPGELELYLNTLGEFRNQLADVGNPVKIFQIGNELNFGPECNGFERNRCLPEYYAEVFLRAKERLFPGDKAILAGLSPGYLFGFDANNNYIIDETAIGNDPSITTWRWIWDVVYYNRVMEEVQNRGSLAAVDGIAIHAYGAGDLDTGREHVLNYFTKDIDRQELELRKWNKPIYVTEMNRMIPGSDESVSVNFLQDAFRHLFNNPRIFAGCWFVYSSNIGEHSNNFSLRKHDQVRKAFQDVANELAHADPPDPDDLLTDGASFVADITIPDGMNMKRGQSFSKVWRLKNAGTSTWSEGLGYSLQFVSGSQMSQANEIQFSGIEVPPGTTFDWTVEMTVPEEGEKELTGNWQMAHSGQPFGPAIWVMINVEE